MAPLLLKRFMERQTREPHRQDPYRSKTKQLGTPRCPECRGVLVKGKWYAETEARPKLPRFARLPSETCPACRQAKDRFAMGVVEIHGEAWKADEEQILATVLNTEKIARSRNDQQRVLWRNTYRNVTKFYVTLPDLARQIGRVLSRSFKGELEFRRSSEEPYLRVVWNSDGASLARSGRHKPGPVKRTRGSRFRTRGRAV